jgi:hypothetical protein
MSYMTLTTLGRLTFRHENGLNYNALGPFRPPVHTMLLSSSMVLCMSLVGILPMDTELGDLTALQLVK